MTESNPTPRSKWEKKLTIQEQYIHMKASPRYPFEYLVTKRPQQMEVAAWSEGTAPKTTGDFPNALA